MMGYAQLPEGPMYCPHCQKVFYDEVTETTSSRPLPNGKCWQMFVTVCQGCKNETVEVQRFQLAGNNRWEREGECLLVYPQSAAEKPTLPEERVST